jgi:hypothetical protein
LLPKPPQGCFFLKKWSKVHSIYTIFVERRGKGESRTGRDSRTTEKQDCSGEEEGVVKEMTRSNSVPPGL